MHVEFYIFQDATTPQVFVALCHLIEKWYHQSLPTTIICQSLQEAQKLDQLLWTYNEQSFLPHVILDENPTPSPIGLCVDLKAIMSPPAILVNLTPSIITDVKPTVILAEIVLSDQTMQQLARERYKHYRDLGLQLKTIKIP